MFGLNAARCSTAPISAATPLRRAISTCSAGRVEAHGAVPLPCRAPSDPSGPSRPRPAGRDPDGAVLADLDGGADDRLGPPARPAGEHVGRRCTAPAPRPPRAARHLDRVVAPVAVAPLVRGARSRRPTPPGGRGSARRSGSRPRWSPCTARRRARRAPRPRATASASSRPSSAAPDGPAARRAPGGAARSAGPPPRARRPRPGTITVRHAHRLGQRAGVRAVRRRRTRRARARPDRRRGPPRPARSACSIPAFTTAIDALGVDARAARARHAPPSTSSGRPVPSGPRRTTSRRGCVRARGSRRSPSVGRRRGRSTPVPGSAPADSGPTTSAPPASMRAMLPPPAPIVWMSTDGSRTGKPGDRVLRGHRGRAVEDQAHVGARPAHVEAQRVGMPAGARDLGRGTRAGRRTGQQQRRGQLGAAVDVEQAAGRGHDHDLRRRRRRARRGTDGTPGAARR